MQMPWDITTNSVGDEKLFCMLHKAAYTSICYSYFFFFVQVKIHAGPNLGQVLRFGPAVAASLHTEYGALECAVEIVDDVDAAIQHINKYGSSNTDAIVTRNG